MKIAYVITRADAVGGASVHVRDLSRAMLDHGHEVCVFVGGSGLVTEQLTAAGIPFRSLRHLQRSIHPVQDLRAYHELKSELRRFEPDIASVHTAKAGWLGRAACDSLRIPVIYTPHGWAIGDRISPRHGTLYTMAERIAAPWSTAIVCVSEAESLLALQKRVGRADQLHVIHNGVRDVPAALRAHPEATPVRLISVARFEPPKDHRALLEALAQLRLLQWELELVGDGPLEGAIREQAARLGLAERIHFAGYLADPAPALARAQIFVLSSRSEGFPRSVLEAMRAGLPVVASDVGGIREAVPTVVQPGALADTLEHVIQSASERKKLGDAARFAYELRFRFEQMFEKTEALYVSCSGV